LLGKDVLSDAHNPTTDPEKKKKGPLDGAMGPERGE